MAFRYDSDSEESEEETIDLYHYTSKKNVKKIMKSKVIKKSTGPGDVLLGKGVYFTTLSPSEGKEQIKQNNWDGNWFVIPDTKVQACIKVSIPTDEVRGCTTDSGREIYMKPGDVDLGEYPHKAYEIKWNETSSSSSED